MSALCHHCGTQIDEDDIDYCPLCGEGGQGMSEQKVNLCDGCALWPCGSHAPIGVDGCIVTTCANRKQTTGELIAALKAQPDELLAAANRIEAWWRLPNIARTIDTIETPMRAIIEAIANAEKDKPEC